MTATTVLAVALIVLVTTWAPVDAFYTARHWLHGGRPHRFRKYAGLLAILSFEAAWTAAGVMAIVLVVTA